MRSKLSSFTLILSLFFFAVAFAFVESAVVIYLRQLLVDSRPVINRREIWLLLPGIAFLTPGSSLQFFGKSALLNIELVREAATIIMIMVISFLTTQDFKSRSASFFFIFGVWDIFYYVFLRIIINWPSSLGDLDIFFLLPVPWVGPVFVPIVISLVLVTSSLIYISSHKP